MKTVKNRIEKLEKRINYEKKEGINHYEELLCAVHSGQKIDYGSTPYLRRLKKLFASWNELSRRKQGISRIAD